MKRPLLAAALAVTFSANAVIAAPNSPEIVIDVQSGQVLHADEATRYWYPASTTKMMTAYVALRAVKAGTITLDTPLVASSRAAGQKPSKLGIKPGQEITLDNALKILMVKSANDLAVVVAEGIGGSIPGFAQMMNAEAARLGMRETRYVNPHGFHDPNHFTSARDLAILGRAMLVEFPEYRGYWGIGAVALGNKVMKNTNGLIGRYPGAEGLKTGFVCASGFNVVALANRGGRQLLTVVLGAGSGAERTIRAAQLFDQGFGSWGGGQGSVTGLASGVGYGNAPNMRGEICRKGRMHLLTEEDTGGAMAFASASQGGSTDSSSVFAVGQPVRTASRVGAVSGSRPVLGPRAPLETIPVFLGRAPGSTAVARGPGNGAATARTATAFAPQPASTTQAAARAKPQPVQEAGEEPAAKTTASVGAPVRLLRAAITQPGPGAIGVRKEAGAKNRPGAIEKGKASKSGKAGAITAKGKAEASKAKVAKVEPKQTKSTAAAKAEKSAPKKAATKSVAKSAAKTQAKKAAAD